MSICWGLILLAAAGSGRVQDTTRLRTLLAIEDARPRDRAALQPLVDAASGQDTLVARWSVRGLGRQERADLIPVLAPLLGSATAAVRAEAANAIGQSALRDGTKDARRLLEDRVGVESDPAVLGAVLRTLGRLPTATPEERSRTETLLVQVSTGASGNAPEAVLEGAAHGLGSLYRRTAAKQPPAANAIERLVAMTAPRQPEMVRRLAMTALVASGATDSGMLLDALGDRAREVRRLAVLAAVVQPSLAGRERVVHRAWTDPDPGVRYEALRAFARHMAAQEGCAPVAAALDDTNPQVVLLATDLLGGCGRAAADRLITLARAPLTADAWHQPAHALVALARLDSSAAASVMPAFLASRVPWARMYAARAAEQSNLLPSLMRLAHDADANVREAAITGLHHRVGHAADSLYLGNLASKEYQVVLAAAQALDSTPGTSALSVLLRALSRLTAERRENTRDPRAALLTTIGHVAGPSLAPSLRGYAADFDTAIASQAAAILTRITGTTVEAAPRPLARAAVPSWTDLRQWARLTAVFTMQGGGLVTIRLRPFDAPTNVARFVRMVRSGWFAGLTFHRLVPNFVIQGGSPAANEYVGDGPFTRDELGLASHVRGTVGISTRGRDTGDGQLFVNLIDNWRLDHDYTIIGEVVQGMDVVDHLLEGVVIERVELRP